MVLFPELDVVQVNLYRAKGLVRNRRFGKYATEGPTCDAVEADDAEWCTAIGCICMPTPLRIGRLYLSATTLRQVNAVA